MFARWKKIDIFIAILFLLTNISYIFLNKKYFPLFLWTLIIFASIRLLIIIKKKLFWKVRNRLFFSSLFLVITPVFFIAFFFFIIVNLIIAQYCTVIFDNAINNQLIQIKTDVESFLNLKDRERIDNSIKQWIESYPEHFNFVFFEKTEDQFERFLKYPDEFADEKLIISDFSGYFKINNKLYFGVLKQKKDLAILISILINQELLDLLTPISDFSVIINTSAKDNVNAISINPNSIKIGNEEFSINEDEFFKQGFPLPYKYEYLNFNKIVDAKPLKQKSFFWLQIKYDKIYDKIKGVYEGSLKNNLQKFILFIISVFGTLIIISLFIGFRMIRVITRSINQINRGTDRIKKGDFSFRIKTKSRDQLQDLAESFNEMAAGIKRLLVEEKEKQRLEEELRIARSIQLKLLPSDTFETKDYELAAVNIPAEEIAGDYFDFFYKENKHLTILVADVSGKGASAAFYMAELKGLINYLQENVTSPASLISECHNSLYGSFDRVTFITMSMAKFLIPEKKFILSRAGHTQALFYNAAKKECLELYPSGIAIGLPNFTQEKIEEIEIQYSKGDILFLFSDGLSEIMNNNDEFLGTGELSRILCQNHHLSSVEIKKKMLDLSIAFSGSEINRDDLTFIILKIK